MGHPEGESKACDEFHSERRHLIRHGHAMHLGEKDGLLR